MVRTLDAILQRYMPWLAPSALVVGLVWGQGAGDFVSVVPWLFGLMTFSAGLGLKLNEFKAVMARPLFLPVSLCTLHVVMPLCALGFGNLVFSDHRIVVGLVIIALTPVGTSSVVWVNMYKGNLSLALSIILADTLLAPLIIPFMLDLLAGTKVTLDMWGIMSTLFWMILFPSCLAVLSNRLSRGAAQRVLAPWLSPAAKLGIFGILAINGGVASPYFQAMDLEFFMILTTVFGICCLGYVFSFLTGLKLFTQRGDIMAFTLCGGLRNVGTGTVIAIMYFSPLTAFTVVLGMLFQQILGYNAGRLADKVMNRRQTCSNNCY